MCSKPASSSSIDKCLAPSLIRIELSNKEVENAIKRFCSGRLKMKQWDFVKKALQRKFSRRGFIHATSAAAGSVVLGCATVRPPREAASPQGRTVSAAELPTGSSPPALKLSHFPDPLHAFVWRNWPLVPVERMAAVVSASPAQIVQLGRAMGLPAPPRLTREQQRRSYITVIKRNWHLLPYE